MHDKITVSGRRPPHRDDLFSIASEQAGHFTSQQAHTSGYSRALLSHHVKSGLFERVRRGLYRFRSYPPHPHEDAIAAWLALGKDRAIVSHESALVIHELSDVIPAAIHFTIPRSARYKRRASGTRIHTTTRPPSKREVVVRRGLPVTTAARSIIDSADELQPDQLEQAIQQALQRGLTTRSELVSMARQRGGTARESIERAFARFP